MFIAIIKLTFKCIYHAIILSFTLNSTLQNTVLPFGIDVGILGVAAYYITRLKRPHQAAIEEVFGPEPSSKEGSLYPEKVVKCIAHRGAGLDAPENTLQAFKYVSIL